MAVPSIDRRDIVAANLNLACDILDVTQGRLGDVIGVDRRIVNKYAKAKHEPSWERLTEIAAALETELRQLDPGQQRAIRAELQINGQLEPGWFYAKHARRETDAA